MYTSGRFRLMACSSLLSALAAFAVGCAEESFPPPPPPTLTSDTPEPVDDTESPAEVSGLPSGRQAFDGLKFVVPSEWKQAPLSDFQKGVISARFTMPAAGPDITLTLSRSGGGTDANLDRWRGQVAATRPEIVDSISLAGFDATLIDMEGLFSGGFGKPPQAGWRVLGIIVPLSDQGYFLKLTGPTEEVSAVEEQFLGFARSAIPE